jgi:hypothetical protein
MKLKIMNAIWVIVSAFIFYIMVIAFMSVSEQFDIIVKINNATTEQERGELCAYFERRMVKDVPVACIKYLTK